MNGRYSHEALAAIAGEELIADVERQAAQASAPTPEAIATAARIFAPTIRRLARRQRTVPIPVAASMASQEAAA